jgi:hypothetical protein
MMNLTNHVHDSLINVYSIHTVGIDYFFRCAISQAISLQLLTAETWVQSWGSPCGFCGRQVLFFQVLLCFPIDYCFTNPPCSYSSTINAT